MDPGSGAVAALGGDLRGNVSSHGWGRVDSTVPTSPNGPGEERVTRRLAAVVGVPQRLGHYPGYFTHYEELGCSISHHLVVVGYDDSGSFVLNEPGITRCHRSAMTYDQLIHAIDDLDLAFPSLNSGRVFLVLAPPASS